KGVGSQALRKVGGQLEMNGRAVFNFALQEIPRQLNTLLEKSQLSIDDIDIFLLHQGSRFMLENIIQRSGIPAEKAPIDLAETGNTVSSSIPFLMEKELMNSTKTIVISGFGVGLSWASAVYRLIKQR
ncbi:MAG TPA: 3-oxoacyl-ACP synthase, partial [Maribacter sp.]|nr:3-oxoacyl-ACP synthase [Maribacter sp.]